MTAQQPPAPSREPFTVTRTERRPGAWLRFAPLFVLFVVGMFLMGAGASWGDDGNGNAWVFSLGLLVACSPFFIGMTFNKR
ncbi:hypothetical protein KDY119_03688 [Luteimicrobium xylanilyticum]|uniref:Uncharacterized protein n=1 Tax=Luteimicrobium xylanilyticum TaxID=1133546 RepID=A0A5P9QGE4_9MICO|nr:hypothetical protein [Luteimicrobium xylanilyticum]QFV00153.1 hypothetical protein KDY119_03688 [Luteimicrobium xylanilyticum]